MSKLFPNSRDEIEKKIIIAASTIFISKGFEKTTIDDIATSLGVTRPAIYHYYKNKEELFVKVIIENIIKDTNHICSTAFTSDDIIHDAELFFDSLIEIQNKYKWMSQDVDFIYPKNEILKKEINEIQSLGRISLQKNLQILKNKGIFRSDISIRDIVLILSSQYKGLIHNEVMGIDRTEAKRLWFILFSKLIDVKKEPMD